MLKRLLPAKLLKLIRPYYHGAVAWVFSWCYGRPAARLVVIGVTGTAGKSSTVQILAHILNRSGRICGYSTTVDFFDGRKHETNKHGLSMPNERLLQKQLKAMVRAGCRYAIVECTSEGLAQNRHLGINFDAALFTNLSRAHLEAHGSYGNYQAAKARLFAALGRGRKKAFCPEKILGVNCDDPMAGYYLSFAAARKFGVSFKGVQAPDAEKVFTGSRVRAGWQTEFLLDNQRFFLDWPGEFNAQNAALAAACASYLGVGLTDSAAALQTFRGVPGRMESVNNSLGFQIIVDYGCEPVSIKSALESAVLLPHRRLIHVFGATGGHRDAEKRFLFGHISAQFADEIVVTNDDVYDSNPQAIADRIVAGILDFKLRQPPYRVVLDRRQAIAAALRSAQSNDLVLITGKGSEQFLVLPDNQRIDWEDARVVREELAKLEAARP